MFAIITAVVIPKRRFTAVFLYLRVLQPVPPAWFTQTSWEHTFESVWAQPGCTFQGAVSLPGAPLSPETWVPVLIPPPKSWAALGRPPPPHWGAVSSCVKQHSWHRFTAPPWGVGWERRGGESGRSSLGAQSRVQMCPVIYWLRLQARAVLRGLPPLSMPPPAWGSFRSL